MPRKLQPRPVGDFFGPYFTLNFKTPLNLPAAPTNPSEVGAYVGEAMKLVAENHYVTTKLDSIDLRNYAARLTVEAEGASPLKFTLTLTPPYEAALEILDNRLVRIGTIVEVTWGYASGSSGSSDISTDTFVFTINEPPKVAFSRDINITIIGYDPVSSSLMAKERKRIFTRNEFPSDRSLIDAILKDLNYFGVYEVSPEVLESVERPKDPEREAVDEQRDLWLLLNSICLNNNMTFYVSSANKLVFHDISNLATIPEAYRLLWYTQPQNDRDIPMISFSAEALPSFFAAPSKSLLNISYDMDSGTIIRDQVDPASLRDLIRVPPTSQIAGGTESSNTGKGIKVVDDRTTIIPFPPYIKGQDFGAVLSQPDLMDNKSGRAKRLLLEAVFAANNKATVVAPGHPDVFPPMNVFVEGVGKAFSGTYQIMKVKHEIGSGYDMTLDLRRLASPPELMDGEPVKSPVPPTEPSSSGLVKAQSADKTGS